MVNTILLRGRVHTAPTQMRENYGEPIYDFFLEVKRNSDYSDVLPISAKANLLTFKIGDYVEVRGQVRTINKEKLIVYVYAYDIWTVGQEDYRNEVTIEGYLCKQSTIRQTPLTLRTICDFTIAVNAMSNKSYYIPTISWGGNARLVHDSEVGTKFRIVGRLQSRVYDKELPNGEIEQRTTYELCVREIKGVKNEETE